MAIFQRSLEESSTMEDTKLDKKKKEKKQKVEDDDENNQMQTSSVADQSAHAEYSVSESLFLEKILC